jgi:hypothetical protein
MPGLESVHLLGEINWASLEWDDVDGQFVRARGSTNCLLCSMDCRSAESIAIGDTLRIRILFCSQCF